MMAYGTHQNLCDNPRRHCSQCFQSPVKPQHHKGRLIYHPTALVLGVMLCACVGTCFLFLGIPMEVPKNLCAHTSVQRVAGKILFLKIPAKVPWVPSPEPKGRPPIPRGLTRRWPPGKHCVPGGELTLLRIGGRMSDNLRTLGGGGGSGDSHSQVRHRDCRKPKIDPLWLELCSFLLSVCLLVRRRINRSA